ncbi:hypothetical protein JW826_03365 [Candidatus Woesearchaeota archaeon]|nr:hypothetical protein [Candidatus Woesearchaeota archaeon]
MEIYENMKKAYYNNIFDVTRLEEYVHLVIYGLLAFFTPFMLGHPQMVVGTVVNAYLILGATYLKGHKLLPLIILPTFGVVARGMLFGPFTIFVIYMIPFIWAGNAILTYSYRWLRHAKMNYALSVAIGATFKTAFLFGAAYALVKFSIVPALFLTTMGLFQLYTALAGGAVAWGVVWGVEKLSKRA